MSLHKLSAGSGYTYLTRQVAAGDDTARGRGSLGAYYEQRGESPGVWLGTGLSSLESGPGAGDRVSEAQMVALFGRGHHPSTGSVTCRPGESVPGSTSLGAPFVTMGPRVSVAGYDLTFSPVKSVSALWALADPKVAQQIETAHAAAVASTIGWLERTAVFTRLGTGGVRQVDVTGLLAVAFTHRDSRAGDPDLHTHVAVSNKVCTADGRWRALDGRSLYAAIVAASERYNTRLEAQLVDRLGVTFVDRQVRPGTRPVRELTGVPDRLLTTWSSRRTRIVDRQAELLDRFRATYRREPTAAERQSLAQQATLATRPAKHAPRNQAQQREAWRDQAEQILGPGAAERLVDRVLHGRRLPSVIYPGWADRAARIAVATVSAERAVFGTHHVRAELERLARSERIPLGALDPAIGQALSVALSEQLSLHIDRDPDEAVAAAGMGAGEPAELRRRDGSSVYTTAHTQLYTTPTVLDAERKILAAADRGDGRRVPTGLVELALLEARAAGRPLNPGQQAMVRELACSGRRVQVALAPAGTGKTTALGVLSRAWADAGGNVLGAAPSAVAAAALADATQQPAVTLAATLHSLHAHPTGDGQATQIGEVPLGPALLMLVDEAGMAATADLAALIDAVTAAGGSVRLVGDTAQLSSPQAGGILRDLVHTHGAVELDTPVRFTDPAEAAATLAIRAGDPTALDFYTTTGRIHAAGALNEVVNGALAAWAADLSTGHESLLLTGSNALVAELNARARASRFLTSGTTGDAGQREVQLRDGTAASVGDLVLARHNNRDLRITGSAWVKNGDRFLITGLTDDGGLRVRHAPTRRSLTLPAGYVAEHLQLGYAATIHLAQGATVETTHTVLTGTESREQLYVALTRGRHANHLHLTPTSEDDEDPAHPVLRSASASGDPDPLERLTRVLARTDQRPSATSALIDAADPGRPLQAAVERYLDAHTLAAATVPPPHGAGGPLPWLPPPPDPDRAGPHRAELPEYLQRRADLVHALAATITADHLPATGWATALRASDPDLAGRLAVWRAATGVADHPDPLGPAATGTPDVRAQLHAQLQPYLAVDQPTDENRWHDQAAATGLDPARDVAQFRDQRDVAPPAVAPPPRVAVTYSRDATSSSPDGSRERLRTSVRDHERAAALHRQPTARGILR